MHWIRRHIKVLILYWMERLYVRSSCRKTILRDFIPSLDKFIWQKCQQRDLEKVYCIDKYRISNIPQQVSIHITTLIKKLTKCGTYIPRQLLTSKTRLYVHVVMTIHQKALTKLRQDTWQSLLILTGLNSFQGFLRWSVLWKGKSCNRNHLTLKLRPQGLFFPTPWLQMLSLLHPTDDIIWAYPWKNPLMLTLNIRITLPEFCIITYIVLFAWYFLPKF